MADWKVERGPKCCTVTKRPFAEGETYFSALMDTDDLFIRSDFSAEAWQNHQKTDFIAFWKTRIPKAGEEPKRRLVDSEVIYTLFSRIDDSPSREKLTFRYLLALILVRKRFLRFDTIERDVDGEFLILWDRRIKDSVRVLNPEADELTLSAAQNELSSIFDMDFNDEMNNPRAAASDEDDFLEEESEPCDSTSAGVDDGVNHDDL